MIPFPRRFLILIILLSITGCSGLGDPVRTPLIGFGDMEAEYHFDTPQSSWDTFRLPDDTAFFAVMDGALIGSVVGDRGYIWSLNKPQYDNTSIKATLQQTKGSSGNGFGLRRQVSFGDLLSVCTVCSVCSVVLSQTSRTTEHTERTKRKLKTQNYFFNQPNKALTVISRFVS